MLFRNRVYRRRVAGASSSVTGPAGTNSPASPQRLPYSFISTKKRHQSACAQGFAHRSRVGCGGQTTTSCASWIGCRLNSKCHNHFGAIFRPGRAHVANRSATYRACRPAGHHSDRGRPPRQGICSQGQFGADLRPFLPAFRLSRVPARGDSENSTFWRARRRRVCRLSWPAGRASRDASWRGGTRRARRGG